MEASKLLKKAGNSIPGWLKKMVQFLSYVFIFLLGMLCYKNDWFPKPQLTQIKHYFIPPRPPLPDQFIDQIVCQYTAGVPLYTDRTYYDTIGDPRLDSSYVLQLPRHHTEPIELGLHRRVKILRFLTGANDNSSYTDWDTTDIQVYVKGYSCIHTTVVSKIFDPGNITLEAGGPAATSPIIIKELAAGAPDVPVTVFYD